MKKKNIQGNEKNRGKGKKRKPHLVKVWRGKLNS